ncbi:MAG: DNA gyrase subunit A [Deltaproteobacteria bacterium]|nr:DNA gyrase subunit A [Deltaproteobacteria bacterium]
MDAIKNILPINIEDEMKSSYLDYAMSVIIGRALPDVRDGLKPVHRRALYTMHETKCTHAAAYKKSARIVGEVMGKYHPHGDAAIYDTIVRMAQDFNMRYLLVDGQGNFGSVDGDAPAAMRYTEIRMTRIAEELLADIEKETVSFVPNYDGSLVEPTVLPTRIPNLLVNGSSGIAVGMSTNIPPHNLREVIDGIIVLSNNPELKVTELMRYVHGPDFPTGAFIQGREGIRQSYETGRGIIKMRARAEIEEGEKGERTSIIVTEIPYQVNKARLLERIAELVKDKKIEGISDLRDESDRDGMRIVIELKRDAVSQIVLNQLYAMTAMQNTFGVIMLAITNGQPKLMNLKEILEEFLQHRKVVVTKRCVYELHQAEEREHILLGFKIVLDNLDAVIKTIRQSQTPEDAKLALMSGFKLSERQAQAILEMRLQKLTGLEREKILKELKEVQAEIRRLKEILASPKLLMELIVRELAEIKEKYGDERRTEIVAEDTDIDIEDLIAEEEVVVTISRDGFIKRMPVSTYRSQRRGGKGKIGMTTKEEDFITTLFIASTHDQLLIFTNKGRVFKLKVWELPQGTRAARGRAIVNLVRLLPDEKVRTVLPIKDFDENSFIFFATKRGLVKKTALSEYKHIRANGIAAIKLDGNDDLIAVRLSEKDVLLFSRQGKSIRFKADSIRAIGRTTRGVRGMALKSNDEVVGMEMLKEGETVLTATERGYGKRTNLDEYRTQKRGGSGILTVRANAKVGFVVGIKQVNDSHELMITTDKGKIIRLRVRDISTIGRVTQGVRLISVEPDEKVMGIDILGEDEGGEETE